jgi:hypothetical protein
VSLPPIHLLTIWRGVSRRAAMTSLESPCDRFLSKEERITLETLVRQYTAPYCDVIRAKIVLLAACQSLSERGRQKPFNIRHRIYEMEYLAKLS